MRAARLDPPPLLCNRAYLRCLEQQSFGFTIGVGSLTCGPSEKCMTTALDPLKRPVNRLIQIAVVFAAISLTERGR